MIQHKQVALLLSILGVGFAATSVWAQAPEIVMPKRGICAHRGAMSTHPENTLTAFREAIRLGVHQIELDVYLLKDGNLAVIHDATVDRTTDGHGRVADMTVEKIKKLDAGSKKDPKFAGERIPTLDEALALDPEDHPSIRLRERIIAYRNTPPPDSWAGEYVRGEKD